MELESAYKSDSEKKKYSYREMWRRGLLIAAALQVVFLIWLFGLGREEVCRRILSPDTAGYITPAQSILHGNGLPPDMVRTIGYPLFLAGTFWLGGQYGYYLTVVMQSILNLIGTLLFWKLLAAMLPQIRPGLVTATVAIFWYAAFGMALNVLSDFLFGFLLLVFLYVFWLKRGPLWLVVGAGALLAANLTRPCLGPFLLLLPFLKILVRRRGGCLSTTSIVMYAMAIVVSSGINFAFESTRAERCSESYKAFAMRVAVSDTGVAPLSEFILRIEELAGRPCGQLTRHERDALSRRVFIEYISSQPLRFIKGALVNATKYMIAPLTAVVTVATGLFPNAPHPPLAFGLVTVRHLLMGLALLFCMPIWVLALWPEMIRRPEIRDLYLFTLILTLYFIGIASAFGWQGERYRFPALPMLLVCFACNLDSLTGRVKSQLGRHRHR